MNTLLNHSIDDWTNKENEFEQIESTPLSALQNKK
jgi:hypothetical protein